MSDQRTDWHPTHRIPAGGADAWSQPDPDHPTQPLDPGLEVQALDHHGDWTHVLCSNGWTTWVDGRLLEPLATDQPDALVPPALATAMEDGLRTCLEALEGFESGHIDETELQQRLVRAGVFRYQDTLWLLDLEGATWWRYDGLELRRMDAHAG
jgi:hypothetical protein